MQILTFPRPPSINACFSNRKNIGRVKTPRYRKWIKQAAQEIMCQRPKKISGAYGLNIFVDKPKNWSAARGPDLGNFEKPISDILQHMEVIENDSLAEEIRLRWHESKTTEVQVYPIEGE